MKLETRYRKALKEKLNLIEATFTAIDIANRELEKASKGDTDIHVLFNYEVKEMLLKHQLNYGEEIVLQARKRLNQIERGRKNLPSHFKK